MAEEGGGLLTDPPSAQDVPLLPAVQFEAHGLGIDGLDHQRQAHALWGDMEGALLAVWLADEDSGVLGEGLQEGVQAVALERDGQALGLLDPLPGQPGGEHG